MSGRIGYGVMVTLLLAGGCGSSGTGASNDPGSSAGNAGSPGGASGSAGGEPAAAGSTGAGTIGAGSTGGGVYGQGSVGNGGYGTGIAGGGAAGASGAGTSGTGAGDEGGAAGTTGGGGVAGTTWLTPPPVPPSLETPEGATVKLHAHAVGAQIYTCTATGGATADGGADAGATTYAWVLKAPDAKLFDAAGTQVGTHGAGPSWTWRDGSVANGAKVIEVNAPAADAISWLLLRVTSTTGAGMLSDVTYVQRLNTAGGRAPATGCDSTTVGTETRVGYSADYYFSSGGGAASWLTPPTVPRDIAVPTDVRLAIHDRGIGFQIYDCAAMRADGGAADASAATYAWVFKAPNALLYDMTFTPVAQHGAGPSFTSTDGSSVLAAQIARTDASRADAVPQLLLKEVSTTGPGVFSEIAFIQRLNTAGGVAPATGCDASTVDTLLRVPYSADYYFYVSINQPDAGTSD